MKPIGLVEGPVSVLDRSDVDTDQILPAEFTKRIERSGFGEYLFHGWAQEPGWTLPSNPILATGRNFGCGSSREHAPWALQDYGFEAIIAPSFADIFYSNCTKIGLLPVQLPADAVREVMKVGRASVDLEALCVRIGSRQVSFTLPDEARHRLLNGLDEVELTLQQEDAVVEYESARRRRGPLTIPT